MAIILLLILRTLMMYRFNIQWSYEEGSSQLGVDVEMQTIQPGYSV